ncbi:hypothetical protein CH367_20375 [Leptospira barantonii]|uniref:Uncharacterized protein n=1 Tax=Leptospira barantonii TaxID=2023184 RepID=A0ABX4NID4_9LEPT|nr:hypothetical protein CH367_20375 [Leptospira barantonii]
MDRDSYLNDPWKRLVLNLGRIVAVSKRVNRVMSQKNKDENCFAEKDGNELETIMRLNNALRKS